MNAHLRQFGSFHADSSRFAVEPLESIQSEWNGLLENCPDATIYQHRRWLDVLTRAYGFSFKAATLRDRGGDLIAACLLARGKNPFVRKWTGLPCSDSAPPLALNEESREYLLKVLADSPLAPGGRVELRGWAAPAPWQTAECFALWKLDLDRPLSAINRGMAANFRRQLNRGREGSFEIEVDNGLGGLKRFYELAQVTRRRLGVPAQPWRFFRAVFDSYAPSGDLEVWTLSQKGKALVGMVMLLEGDELHYKWSARLDPTPSGATHRLLQAVLEKHAQRFRYMDVGRTDVRNIGLSRFKKELGARPLPLPYSFLPSAPDNFSPEILSEGRAFLSQIWRRLPLPVTRLIGSALYRYIV